MDYEDSHLTVESLKSVILFSVHGKNTKQFNRIPQICCYLNRLKSKTTVSKLMRCASQLELPYSFEQASNMYLFVKQASKE